ncbi:hypothetical protein PENTCL1PPCAC_27276 [Pristionchus entomophagus]|uniref:Uncharacterized protein n=1 Tax=Pristionchus entomophagus TaxID=358040 RepID=A0AAV5UEU5_9BILA|nr:hypothetical protein PENTCL1PPCAC_27276 [Pristionchus entomophagus]
MHSFQRGIGFAAASKITKARARVRRRGKGAFHDPSASSTLYADNPEEIRSVFHLASGRVVTVEKKSLAGGMRMARAAFSSALLPPRHRSVHVPPQISDRDEDGRESERVRPNSQMMGIKEGNGEKKKRNRKRNKGVVKQQGQGRMAYEKNLKVVVYTDDIVQPEYPEYEYEYESPPMKRVRRMW